MYCQQFFFGCKQKYSSCKYDLYTDNLCIKMMGYLWKIDWNHDHQHFLFEIQWKQWKWHGCTCNLFWFLLLLTAMQNQAEQLPSICWHSPLHGWYLTRSSNSVALNNALKQQIEEELECSLHTWCCFLEIPDLVDCKVTTESNQVCIVYSPNDEFMRWWKFWPSTLFSTIHKKMDQSKFCGVI